MNKFKLLLGPMRVPFLILTPACALLGLGTAVWTNGHVSGWHFILALIGALYFLPTMLKQAPQALQPRG